MVKIKDLATIVGLSALNYIAISTAAYMVASASMEIQELIFGKENVIERVEAVVKLADENPYHPSRFMFAGIEAAAINYLDQNNLPDNKSE